MERVRVDVPPRLQHTTTIIEARPGVDASAMIWGSMVAGLVSLGIEMILVAAVYGVKFWAPLRVIASVFWGIGALVPGRPFTVPMVVVGIVVQLVASIIYGFIGIEVLRPRHPLTAIFGVGAWGILIFFINFFIWTAVFPWLALFRDWTWIVSYVVFGVILGLLYMTWRRPRIRVMEL